MKSKRMVICDSEEGYAAALAHYIMKKEELAFQIQTCSDILHVLSVQEKEGIDYLLISASYPQKERSRVCADKIFVLTEGGKSELLENETALYKYQSGEMLLAEFIRQCTDSGEMQHTFLKTVRKKQMRIIGVFSPVRRSGKTSYALELGQQLAEEANVLYLSLETYGGIGGHFPDEMQTLSDVLYYARQEKGNLGLILTTIVGHKGKLDYVAPVQVSEDVKAVSGAEWVELIEKIMEQSIYEILILDMDEGIRDLYTVLKVCSEICMITAEDEIAKAKLAQFDRELILLGHEDVRRKIVWRKSAWKECG